MARALTSDQRALLRRSDLRGRLLTTWWLDDDTYRFCDDTEDLSDAGNTWIGANAIAGASDVTTAGSGFAAESLTITVDGTRLNQTGFDDPAELFRQILALPLANRRVDLELAILAPEEQAIGMRIPLYAGKINNARLVFPKVNLTATSSDNRPQPKLEFVLDSLAARYGWVVGRTRSHSDQLQIDPTDMFFSFVQDTIQGENTLYWGRPSSGDKRIPIIGSIAAIKSGRPRGARGM